MPINSRAKGARFERKVATSFSLAFDRGIRRVPASGGLDIKSDLYDPENDDFRYFIECKFRESYRFSTVIEGISTLFGVYKKTREYSESAYTNGKYTKPQVPIVIFKGGHFRSEWVLIHHDYLERTFVEKKGRTDPNLTLILVKEHVFMPMMDFLRECIKTSLVLAVKVGQEDDGSPD